MDSLVQKLKQIPELLTIYILEDQGFIERVNDDNTIENTHYLPQLPVKKDSVTIRIVYDYSCCGNGNSTSFSDCLTPAPLTVFATMPLAPLSSRKIKAGIWVILPCGPCLLLHCPY